MKRSFEATPITKQILKNNPEIISKWCTALRSGKYKQCKEFLYYSDEKDTGYCCLGVLESSVNNKTDIELAGVGVPCDICDPIRVQLNNLEKILPEDLRFLVEYLDGAKISSEFATPYSLNDDFDLDFNQIADLLECKEVVVERDYEYDD